MKPRPPHSTGKCSAARSAKSSPLSQKTYACFVRRYDANHLAQHPKQKISAMKLLVTAEDAP
ncbi:hypothetical protein [Bradyrhizobium sp. sGM-13]|uniref:hypothetical protein n=1 Tax=Bradyrhizobium sp. sGM-13 TaxID=2831781 RepID=UPI001BCFDF58|nr:hypothetical protein [Bradyrhizobium sp. sGM-13]